LQHGELLAVPSLNYLYLISTSGQVEQTLPISYKGYKPPTAGPQIEKNTMSKFFTWELQWTPIVAVGSTNNLYLVEYQTFNPLRYTIHAWPKDGQGDAVDYQTNSLLLASRGDGKLWFLKNLDNMGAQQYVIIQGTAR
jgi:hypothetical protein